MKTPSSSWTKCVSGLSVSLTIPYWFKLIVWLLVGACVVLSFTLAIDSALHLLLLLGIHRNYVLLMRKIIWSEEASLNIDEGGRLCVEVKDQASIEVTAFELRGRFFNWVHLNLYCNHAKPMEILIFSRYDQRQQYRRLVRHLAQS